jgi:hypothetical protein
MNKTKNIALEHRPTPGVGQALLFGPGMVDPKSTLKITTERIRLYSRTLDQSMRCFLPAGGVHYARCLTMNSSLLSA